MSKKLMHKPWQNGRYIVLGLSLLLVLAILVRQQMSWLNQASASQLASGQKEMSLALTQGLDTVRVQMQVLYSDIAAGNTNAMVTEQLHIHFNQQWPSYAEDDPRTKWVKVFEKSVGESPNPFDLERVFGKRKAVDEFLLISVVHPKLDSEQFDVRILTLDLSALASQLLEPALTDALTDYSFMLSVEQKPLLANGALSLEQMLTQPPDIIFPISRLLQSPLQERRQRSEEAERETSVSVFDRDVTRLYNMILSAFQAPIDPQQGPDLYLTIYSPDGSLAQKINRQKWRNGFFSAMVLGLLSAMVIVLLGMTRRIKIQQQRERDFIASISHELRTPLTVIRSAADNLKDGVVSSPESIAHYGLEISKQSKRLSRMIDTTLTYSGLPGRDSQQLETVHGDVFFRDLFTPLIALATEASVTSHLKIENLDHQITIDADALRTIGQNLVMNALIHAQPDVGPAHLWLRVIGRPNELVITVADNGPGIPKREQTHVFSPFVRGKQSEQKQKPGTGLGLSLVQRTVAILQGDISLRSPYQSDLGQTEKGCMFTVIVPLGAK